MSGSPVLVAGGCSHYRNDICDVRVQEFGVMVDGGGGILKTAGI